MRAFIVVNSLGTGGTERSLSEFLPYLLRAGHQATLIAFRARPDGVESALRREGHDIHLLDGSKLRRLRALRKLIVTIKPDLVHTSLFEADIIGRVASAFTVPVLTSLVNQPYHVSRTLDPNVRRWRLHAARLLDGSTARHLSRHFHAVTQSVKQFYVQDMGFPASRITVVERGRDRKRLGVNTPQRRQMARMALNISPEAPVIVNVGRHEFQKGQRDLVRAFSVVHERMPASRLITVGRTGNATRDLHALVDSLGLTSSVTFLGHREDVPDLLCAADVFAFPSLFEGIGGAALEAMALRLPIVTTPTMEGTVHHDQTALVVPAGDYKALAEGILALLRTPAWGERLAAAAERAFEQRFALEPASQKLIELYERTANMAPMPCRIPFASRGDLA